MNTAETAVNEDLPGLAYDSPPQASIWRRPHRFPNFEFLGVILVVEGLLCIALSVWALYDIFARARATMTVNKVLSGTMSLTYHLHWVRAAEFVLPFLAISALFLWAGFGMIVSRRRKAPLRGAARMAAISAGGAQPTVLAAVALWLSLNPDRVFLYWPYGFGYTLAFMGIYPDKGRAFFEAGLLLLVVGTILAGARVRRRSDLRKVAPVAIGAALLLVGLVWLPIDAFGSQWAAQSEFAPMPAAFWSAAVHPNGHFAEGEAVACEPNGSCLAIGVLGLVKVERLGGTFAWSSAVLSRGLWHLGAVVDVPELAEGPESLACASHLTCLLLVNTYGRSGPSQISLLRSADAGRLWSAVPFPQGSGPAAGATLSCGDGHCFVISRNELVRSDDGGIKWRVAAFLPSTKDESFSFSSVGCSSSWDCFAFVTVYRANRSRGSNVVYASRNGGQSWSFEAELARYSGLSTVSCTGVDCYVTSSVSSVRWPFDVTTSLLETRNNGASWHDLGVIPRLGAVVALVCPRAGQCLATGDAADFVGEVTLRTANNGDAWQTPAGLSVPSLSLLSLACSSESVCVAAGSAGRGALLAMSTDGGRRWILRPYPRMSS